MFFASLFLILVGGVILFFLCKLCHLPALIGYLLWGILLGYLGWIDSDILAISPQIRKIALVIILTKAGLSLNLDDLKKVGRPAILMSFVPACVEMVTIGLLGPVFFPALTTNESFIIGSVLGAVSPAVVVPMMVKLLEEKRGTAKGIPGLVIAGSSADDIVMIVFYTVFLSMESGGKASWLSFANIPISILTGIAVGIGLGFLFSWFFGKVHLRDSLKLVLLFGVGFGLVWLEDYLSQWFGFSSLLAVITQGLVIMARRQEQASRLSVRCSKMWVVAEVFLFVLVGASLKVSYFASYLVPSLGLLACSLGMRSLGVNACLIKTKLNAKERLFVTESYLPKATVQAAIGGGLLDLGTKLNNDAIIQGGTIVLSVSVVAILLTAPLGAILMGLTYKPLLGEPEKPNPAEA
ncbi:MAG: cation:proton antiporter [Bacilli bacterium]|jgi:NhaP-type Na+/H+ or K+/H+ antiporter|nr:cation:proton antiporter [Bacilli bacterium]